MLSLSQFPKVTFSSIFFSQYSKFLDFFCQRAEIVEWVDQGGGEVVKDQVKRNVNFIIECHGVIPRSIIDSKITYVSTHWIRSCLEVCLKLLLWP